MRVKFTQNFNFSDMIEQRLEILEKLRHYMSGNTDEWQEVKERAERKNGWFTGPFVQSAVDNICNAYLEPEAIRSFSENFRGTFHSGRIKTIGIAMAGNIPLVGFHDFLSVFVSGHKQRIKFSSKDDQLLAHLITKLYEWDASLVDAVNASDMLKGCDAYIATGSANTARYFEYYFGPYPHIIRRNRTSVAILTGNEEPAELSKLADDVYLYFGLGCRNVTKLFVPEGYDFIPLLNAFRKYDELKHHNKYRNNLDYNLALFILNKQFYMSNESILLIENDHLFSPVSVLNYSYYTNQDMLLNSLRGHEDIQAICGHDHIPFGEAQQPGLMDFADGVNVIDFLKKL